MGKALKGMTYKWLVILIVIFSLNACTISSYAANPVDLDLTQEEQEYLDTVGPILIKGFDGRQPLSYTDEEGNYRGILADYLDYLGDMSGLTFIYEPAEGSMSFAQHAAVMEAEDYGMFYAERSLEELQVEDENIYKTDQLFNSALAYIERKGESVSKYGSHVFALNKSLKYVEDMLLQTNSKSRVLFFDTSQECMEAVMEGDAEMAILDEHVATYLMQKPDFADHLTRTPGSGVHTEGICLYVPEQHKYLADILNKTLEQVSERQRLYMVSNLSLSHAYKYQLEDMLYEYGTLILLVVLLLIIILTLAATLYVRVNRFKRQKRETEALQIRLQTDELTGVCSRNFFFEKAQEMIRKEGVEWRIIRLNVNNFRIINELYGSEKGDVLLKEIGYNLKRLSEKYNFIAARFTADRFYLCIDRNTFYQVGFSDRASVSWLEKGIKLSYGVYPVELERGIPVSAMCDRADSAITAGKEKRIGHIYLYSDAIYQQMIYEQEIEGEMEMALSEGQFCVYIQPKYDVETEQLIGGEALVRWKHPQKGMIPPGDFIGVFEKNGFILKLDHYVWEESCRFLAERREKGLPIQPISVNVSRIHFYHTGLKKILLGILEKYHLETKYLELEITESIYSEEPELILQQCEELRELGFRIAMDDFGSGYSSLNMLKQIPLDIIKMDLRFLSEDMDDKQAKKGQDILRTQIELAHALELDVVVEGLETLEQRNFIRSIGRCSAQGYFYSRPVDCQSYADLLQN